jgi:hypothetical protein
MESNLEHIEHMLSLHHRDKSIIMENAITERLTKSLLTYVEELDSGVGYITNKSELNVLKKL